ncbi:MAG TPA: hypothetical protein VF892_17195 [Pseudonocardiaceae bacterium]
MVGVTEMPGIDDFGAAETFTTNDATTVENWAVSKGISSLSMWAVQRDNGGCVGTKGSGTCSGVAQSTWQFSHTFQPFTTGGTQQPPPTTTTTPPPTTTTGGGTGGSCSGVAAWNSQTAYPGGSVVTNGGHQWTANQWNEDEVPGGPSGAWDDNGPC